MPFWPHAQLQLEMVRVRDLCQIASFLAVPLSSCIQSVQCAKTDGIHVHLAIKNFRCYEAKIEESEKAGSRRESNPGHLWLEPPVLCH